MCRPGIGACAEFDFHDRPHVTLMLEFEVRGVLKQEGLAVGIIFVYSQRPHIRVECLFHWCFELRHHDCLHMMTACFLERL
jgi:hypothetical protein